MEQIEVERILHNGTTTDVVIVFVVAVAIESQLFYYQVAY
jgi:hypothetical protein